MTSDEIKSFENELVNVILKDKTIFVTYKDNAKVTLKGAENMTKSLKELINNEPLSMIADIRNLHFVDKDARKYLGTDAATSHVKCLAIYSDNYVNNALGNFYLLVNKPKTPSKMFSSMDKAIEWVSQF